MVLHQAPRAWYETLSTYLLDKGFQRGQINKTLFIKRVKGDILLVQVYVDDIILDPLRRVYYELCEALPSHTKFHHLMLWKRKSLETLKGQPKLGLWYHKDSPFDLETYTDSDYAGDSLDRKSTTGGLAMECLISERCFDILRLEWVENAKDESRLPLELQLLRVQGRHEHDMEPNFEFTALEEVYTTEKGVSTAEPVSTAGASVSTTSFSPKTRLKLMKKKGRGLLGYKKKQALSILKNGRTFKLELKLMKNLLRD
ncbi:putative ribonuclease H-like domain-containing protein [Tanacetum coccineum]